VPDHGTDYDRLASNQAWMTTNAKRFALKGLTLTIWPS
jgi:hypothetical protein